MSDSEARERRRNKILASKEERMSRILGGQPKPSTELDGTPVSEVSSAKTEEKPSLSAAAPKIKPVQKEKSPEKVTIKTPLVKPNEEKTLKIAPISKVSRISHLTLIIISALFGSALNYLRSADGKFLGFNLGSMSDLQIYYTILTLFFCVQSEEFLFGRLSSPDGAPFDSTLLLKDMALFALILIASTYLY